MAATVLLFHHAHGQTKGFLAFADELRRAGHTVHTPDLFAGKTFARVEDGVAHAQKLGFENVIASGVAAAANLPADVVYAGFSLGGMPAQKLAQTRPGARGALLFHACVPPSTFGVPWPAGVPYQIHYMQDDPWMEEDRAAAEAMAREVPGGELFVYAGSGHLFADTSSEDYDPEAAALLTQRVATFLARAG